MALKIALTQDVNTGEVRTFRTAAATVEDLQVSLDQWAETHPDKKERATHVLVFDSHLGVALDNLYQYSYLNSDLDQIIKGVAEAARSI